MSQIVYLKAFTDSSISNMKILLNSPDNCRYHIIKLTFKLTHWQTYNQTEYFSLIIEAFAFYANQLATLLIHTRKMIPTRYPLLSLWKQTRWWNLSHLPTHFRTSRKHQQTYSQHRIQETLVFNQTCLIIHGPLPRTQNFSIHNQQSPPHSHKRIMVAYHLLKPRYHLTHPNTRETFLNISNPISLSLTILKLPLPIPQVNTKDLLQ